MEQKLAIATISMGWHPSHTLENKIAAAKKFGMAGLELFDSDLNKFAELHAISRLEAADEICRLCKDAQVKVMCYSSLSSFEGQPTSLSSRLETAKEWFEIVRHVDCELIQIPSNFDAGAIGDKNVIVADLQALSDLGLQQSPPISFAYEAVAWGKHVADWEESLQVVKLVDRPNFGLCLDTYHVLARLWADPTTQSGRRPGGDAALGASIQRFRDTCPSNKIFYVQLSDAEQANPPILPGHPAYHADQHPTFSWCLESRVAPFDKELGAYLPLEEILMAWLVESGWKGWVSMELFHRSMKDQDSGPEIWAKRARGSWDQIQKMLQAKRSRRNPGSE